MEHPFRDLRQACDAVATAAENTAAVFRQRAAADSFDRPDLRVAAQGWDQLAVELREISSGEGVVRSTPLPRAVLEYAMAQKTCGECEYFDRHHGDCLSSNSPRYQTDADRQACPAFYPDTTADAGRAALEQGS